MARAGKPGPSRNWWQGTLTLVTGALLVYGITGAQTGASDSLSRPMTRGEWKENPRPTGYRALLDTTTRPIRTETRLALRRFVQETMIPWRVEWNERTGGVKLLAVPYGHPVDFPGRGATRQEKALNFVSDYKRLLWPPDSSMSTARPEFRIKEESYRHILIGHFSEGVEVFKSRISVTFNPDGEIHRVSAPLWKHEAVSTIPALTTEALADVIKNSGLVQRWTGLEGEPQLLIFPSRPARLIYRAGVKYGRGFLVDAHSGEIIWVESRGLAEPPAPSQEPDTFSLDTLDPDPNMQDLVGRWRAGKIDDTSREYRIMMRELRRIDPSMKPPPKRGKREEREKAAAIERRKTLSPHVPDSAVPMQL